MRKITIFLMALAMAGLCAGSAQSTERTLSKRYGKAELKSACEAAGGHYGEGSAGYGCEKQCTSGGDYCVITCSNAGGKCKGDTPARVAPNASIDDILHGGKMSAAAGAAPAKRAVPAAPQGETMRK
jgi:hypothetical protein